MRLLTRFLVFGPLLLVVACGTNETAAEPTLSPIPTATSLPTVIAVPTVSSSIEFISDQMVGDWIGPHETQINFSDDGSYRFGPIAPPSVFDEFVFEQGTWELNEGVLSWVSNESSLNCQPGQRGDYRVTKVEEPIVILVVVSDPCPGRRLTDVPLERIP